jgi:AbrB family looped-hinge helix DNA binding protein
VAYAATVSSKGQLVIPAKLRKKYGLRGGTKLSIGEADGKIVIQVNRNAALLSLYGTLAGYSLEKDLMDDPIRARE